MQATLDDTRVLTNENMCSVTYDAIIAACRGDHYTMSLTGDDDIIAVMDAVAVGIDSRLQACFCRERGDNYETGERSFIANDDGVKWKKGDKVVYARTLECSVSPESLPVLLRRMFEADADLPASILYSLGFSDTGEFIGRED
jgi:hypothetical protein|tara:strand:+ start:783 stop:1211 length:429 start_codon:yes stop_codon:yes gene_type:complete